MPIFSPEPAFALARPAYSRRSSAHAASDKAKSTQSEGKWVKFDSAAKLVTLKITKEGKGAKPPRASRSRRGATRLQGQPTGSVLSRTSVAINGKKGEIGDIPEGKTVPDLLLQDERDPKSRLRKIDVILCDESSTRSTASTRSRRTRSCGDASAAATDQS